MSNTSTPTETVSRRVGLGKVEIAHAPAHLTAVLGSCVGIAIYDRQTATGTLAHIVIPHGKDQGVAALSYAQEAIDESLTMLKESGCNLDSAIAKMAGGARMFGSDELRVREQQNIAAVRRAVEAANIELCGEDLGGSKGRRVTLDALTGEFLIEIPGEDSVTL